MKRLFFDRHFQLIEEEIWISIIKRLKDSNFKTVRVDEMVSNIIGQQQIDIPEIGNEKDISVTMNLEDSDGKVYEPNPNAQYGNNFVTAVATFKIPFNGNKDFFFVHPTKRVEVGRPAIVSANNLIIKIPTDYVRLELTDQWKSYIRNSITEIKKNIELNLDFLRNDKKRFIDSLDGDIRAYIKEQQDKIEAEEKRNREINPFSN